MRKRLAKKHYQGKAHDYCWYGDPFKRKPVYRLVTGKSSRALRKRARAMGAKL